MELPDIESLVEVQDLIDRSLREDVGAGDVTTDALVPENAMVDAVILARETCIVSGTTIARAVFKRLDPHIQCAITIAEGQVAAAGQTIMSLKGMGRAILTGERTALNFMQRMTGIATMTHRFVEAVQPYGTTILDTRKTTPTLRVFEKYAVLCGGGENHRIGLYDRAMIKDNHRALWHKADASRLDLAVREVRNTFPGTVVEVEVESVEELECALNEKPEWVLLDNMTPEMMRQCVEMCRGISKTEASGGITLKNVKDAAAAGVDAISLGCLTHSAPSADLSLEVES